MWAHYISGNFPQFSQNSNVCEICSIFYEFKVWFMFYLSYHSAVCSIGLYRTVLQRDQNVHDVSVLFINEMIILILTWLHLVPRK